MGLKMAPIPLPNIDKLIDESNNHDKEVLSVLKKIDDKLFLIERHLEKMVYKK